MNMKSYLIVALAVSTITISACGRDDRNVAPAASQAPATVAPQTERQYDNMATQAERRTEGMGGTLDDAAVTAKVKTALIMASDLSGFAINVDTVANVVTLAGTVETESLRQKAESVAKDVEGVQSVKNELTLKQRS